MTIPILIGGLVFGSVGLAYWVYGKRQQRLWPLLCGAGLMAFPFFVNNLYLFVLLGITLVALPYFFRNV